MQRQNGNETVG